MDVSKKTDVPERTAAPTDGLARRCILVGTPERAALIADKVLSRASRPNVDGRLHAGTGEWNGVKVSVIACGTGALPLGTALAEATKEGVREFVRVGTCTALAADLPLGETVIATGAARLDAVSENWAPVEFPAVPDWRMVADLKKAAMVNGVRHHLGVGITVPSFYMKQGARHDGARLPPLLRQRHERLAERGALYASIEEAELFVWCAVHGGLPCGAVATVTFDRATHDGLSRDDGWTTRIALDAIVKMRI